MGYSVVIPWVGMRHLEGPKNPDGLNLGIYVFVYVHRVHVYVYARRWDEILKSLLFSLAYSFFRKRKAIDENAKPPIISHIK